MVKNTIKPLTDVIEDVATKLHPRIDKQRLRADIMQEVCSGIIPIINEIDVFLQSNPKYKKDLYEFRDTKYGPLRDYAYNHWAEGYDVFEDIIMEELQRTTYLNDENFKTYYQEHIKDVYEIVWHDFVNAIRERLRNLPVVYIRGVDLKKETSLDLFKEIRKTLAELICEIEAS